MITAADVVTPPHPPTYFPDLKAPPALLVASLLEDKALAWPAGCTAKDTASCAAELVLLGSIAGHSVRHEVRLYTSRSSLYNIMYYGRSLFSCKRSWVLHSMKTDRLPRQAPDDHHAPQKREVSKREH